MAKKNFPQGTKMVGGKIPEGGRVDGISLPKKATRCYEDAGISEAPSRGTAPVIGKLGK